MSSSAEEWRDGFPMMGNLLCLDFLNTAFSETTSANEGVSSDLLCDGEALGRWLFAAGLIPLNGAFRGRTVPKELLAFRDRLKEEVDQLEAGSKPSVSFVEEVNRLLGEYPGRDRLVQSDAGTIRTRVFEVRNPLDALGPLAESAAELLTKPNWTRLRKCGTCVLHFWDTSKKGNRLWCSMATCGNRAKVAAYTKRKRART